MNIQAHKKSGTCIIAVPLTEAFALPILEKQATRSPRRMQSGVTDTP